MISFVFFLALQPISRKTECRVNLHYLQVVYSAITCIILINAHPIKGPGRRMCVEDKMILNKLIDNNHFMLRAAYSLY